MPSYGVIAPAAYAVVLPRHDCCQDCWDLHRAAGLPATADHACCAGTCGVDPRIGKGTAIVKSKGTANVLWFTGALVVAGLLVNRLR